MISDTWLKKGNNSLIIGSIGSLFYAFDYSVPLFLTKCVLSTKVGASLSIILLIYKFFEFSTDDFKLSFYYLSKILFLFYSSSS